MRTMTIRRLALGLALAAGAACLPAHALVFGVTEGVTYRATDNQIEAKFAPLAELLGQQLKQPVQIKVLSSYKALRESIQRKELDLVFVHPAHVAFDAIAGGGYQAAAWTAGYTDYKVAFLCKKGVQAISDWAQVAGKSLVTPDPDSVTAVMTRAMLREHGLAPSVVKLQTTRYQDAVPFYVENGFAAYGATAAKGVIRTWKEQGGEVCAESRPVPIKQWLASRQLDAATQKALRDALLGLAQTEAGQKALKAAGYTGLVEPSAATERALSAWLGA